MYFLCPGELKEFLWSFVNIINAAGVFTQLGFNSQVCVCVFICVCVFQRSWKSTCRVSWQRPTHSTAQDSSRWFAMTNRKDWSGPESAAGELLPLLWWLCSTRMWSSTLDGEEPTYLAGSCTSGSQMPVNGVWLVIRVSLVIFCTGR